MSVKIVILPAAEGEVPLLVQQISGTKREYENYLHLQKEGKATFLVAWEDKAPVGRLLIRWDGSLEIPRIVDRMPIAAKFAGYPSFENIEVRLDRRGRGIGTALIKYAEQLARQRKFERAVIEVDIDNPRARALYERLGYAELGLGVFTTSGTYVDDAGHIVEWTNGPQVLLIKKLSENTSKF
ncbi:GNAT family N-acetyltransferase [Candidatus Bathyarchaeota archaeon]|nr:GNAT family N-acetyltransferase [Candidatus Bathyarchaeota archaeon]